MADEPKMLFYDDDGKRVAEGSPQARRQFLSDDPLRPDAQPEERAAALTTVFGDRTAKPVKLLYYDAAGKRVPEGSPDAVRQFTSDDPSRPDADAGPATPTHRTTSTTSTETGKADAVGDDPLAARRALVARAKDLGIPATGKSDELAAAIAAAEAKAKSGPDETKARTSPDETKGE